MAPTFGLDANHPLSKKVRSLAAQLIQDERVLAWFHQPWVYRLTRPTDVPAELWDFMTDEHKELVILKMDLEIMRDRFGSLTLVL